MAATLRKETGEHQIEFQQLDLASLASVQAFVKQFLALGRDLHLLINNAGIMATPLSFTVDGFESQFGTNHVGHFALATGLLPALKAAGQARVVSLSSLGHHRSDVHFDDLNFRPSTIQSLDGVRSIQNCQRALRRGNDQRFGPRASTRTRCTQVRL